MKMALKPRDSTKNPGLLRGLIHLRILVFSVSPLLKLSFLPFARLSLENLIPLWVSRLFQRMEHGSNGVCQIRETRRHITHLLGRTQGVHVIREPA